MTNFQVYKKVLSFSLLHFVVGLMGIIVLAGCATAGFFIFNNSNDHALIGLAIGAVVGVVKVRQAYHVAEFMGKGAYTGHLFP